MFVSFLRSARKFRTTPGRRGPESRPCRQPRLERLEERCLLNAGSLDLTFGVGGKVSTDLGNSDSPASIAVQADGKIVIAGFAGNSPSERTLIRYLPDGSLDPTFGVGGVRRETFGTFDSPFFYDLVVLPDGDLVAIGEVADSSFTRFRQTIGLYRSTDGALLNQYLGPLEGFSPTTLLSRAVAVQPDDSKIVVGGLVGSGDLTDLAIRRFNANLTPDSAFGTVRTTLLGPQDLKDLVIQGDGKIVVGGTTRLVPGQQDFLLVRYNADGSPDDASASDSTPGDAFGVNGIATIDLGPGSNDALTALGIQPGDQKIVAAGARLGSGAATDFAVVRLNTDGSLDNDPTSGFGPDHSGKVFTDLGKSDVPNALVIQDNGKIVLAGYSGIFTGTDDFDFALARYSPEGTLDAGFGQNGTVVTSFGRDDRASALALQPDGRIVAAGRLTFPGNTLDFGLARYEGDPTTPVPPPTIESLQVNDGSAQRSMVTSLTITFSGEVVFLGDPNAAFVLTNSDGTPVEINVDLSLVDGKTVAVLTFTGPDVLGGSLADGRYSLTLLADHIHDSEGQSLDGDHDGVAGGDVTDEVFRFFGDSDGDGDVDNLDFFRLRGSFNKTETDPGYLWYFDHDGDGDVHADDLQAFLARRGKAL